MAVKVNVGKAGVSQCPTMGAGVFINEIVYLTPLEITHFPHFVFNGVCRVKIVGSSQYDYIVVVVKSTDSEIFHQF